MEDLVAPKGQPQAGLAGAPLRLRRRAEFLHVGAKGRRLHSAAFSLQAAPRQHGSLSQDPCVEPVLDNHAPRFGFTVTKKTGNAVKRNRIRRRLKEALRLSSPLSAQQDHDYVLVARAQILTMPFAELAAELKRALARISDAKHFEQRPRRPMRGNKTSRSDIAKG